MKKINKKIVMLTILIPFLFTAAVSAGIDPASTPDQSEYPNASAIILDTKTTADYTKKPYTIKVQETIKIFNQRGIKRFGEVKIRYDKQREEVEILNAETIKKNGERVKVKKDAINEITPPELSKANIYSHVREKVLNMPGLKPGTIITYSYEKKIKNPVLKGEFWVNKYLQSTDPIQKSSLVIKVPDNKKINYNLKSTKTKPKITRKDEFKKYSWKVENVKGIVKENSMPALANILNQVTVSTLDSWQEVSDWYTSLLDEQFKANRELKDKVATLCKGKNKKKEKIEAVYNYVATNIRYVGLEFGIGSYKPHNAVDVFNNKYGDCKDKAVLLITMLNQINVEAVPVLINSRADPQLDIVSPAQFNHMIVYLPQKDLYLDPTSNVTRYGDLPPGDQGKTVLLPTKAKIKETPIMAPTNNQEIINIDVKIDKNGKAQIKADWSDYGYYDSVYKQLFRRFNQARRDMVVRQIVKRSLPDAQIKSHNLSGVEGLTKNFRLQMALSSSSYFSQMGDNYSIRPFIFPMNFQQLVNEDKRTYPLNLGVTLNFTRRIKIELPDGYQVNYLPESIKVDNKVGSLLITYQNKGEQLKIDLNLKVKKKEIPVAEYEMIKQLFNKINQGLQKQILIKKK